MSGSPLNTSWPYELEERENITDHCFNLYHARLIYMYIVLQFREKGLNEKINELTQNYFRCDESKELEFANLNLSALHLNPHRPVRWLGFLILPPISLPMPKMDPPADISEDSPPEEPPEPLLMSCGLHVTPNIGLLTSYLISKEKRFN